MRRHQSYNGCCAQIRQIHCHRITYIKGMGQLLAFIIQKLAGIFNEIIISRSVEREKREELRGALIPVWPLAYREGGEAELGQSSTNRGSGLLLFFFVRLRRIEWGLIRLPPRRMMQRGRRPSSLPSDTWDWAPRTSSQIGLVSSILYYTAQCFRELPHFFARRVSEVLSIISLSCFNKVRVTYLTITFWSCPVGLWCRFYNNRHDKPVII